MLNTCKYANEARYTTTLARVLSAATERRKSKERRRERRGEIGSGKEREKESEGGKGGGGGYEVVVVVFLRGPRGIGERVHVVHRNAVTFILPFPALSDARIF